MIYHFLFFFEIIVIDYLFKSYVECYKKQICFQSNCMVNFPIKMRQCDRENNNSMDNVKKSKSNFFSNCVNILCKIKFYRLASKKMFNNCFDKCII